MENVLEVFILMFYYARIFGLAPFLFKNNCFEKSKAWYIFSYAFFAINLILQLFSQYIMYNEFNAEEKLKNFVRICDLLGFPLNSIISSIIILLNFDVFQNLQNFNMFYRKNQKDAKIKNIKHLKSISYLVFWLCIISNIFLNSTQCYCWIGIKIGQVVKCLAVITRSSTTLAISGLFVIYLHVIRFCYQIINNILLSIIRSLMDSKKDFIKRDNMETVMLIRCLMSTEFSLKDVIERINGMFGFFNLLVVGNAFIETVHVLVFRVAFPHETHCVLKVAYYWLIYCVLMLVGSVVPSMLVEKEVSRL